VRDQGTILAAEEFKTNPSECSVNKLTEDYFIYRWHQRASHERRQRGLNRNNWQLNSGVFSAFLSVNLIRSKKLDFWCTNKGNYNYTKLDENSLILRNITFGVSQNVYEGKRNGELLIQRYTVLIKLLLCFSVWLLLHKHCGCRE